jgi:hypothetical protein
VLDCVSKGFHRAQVICHVAAGSRRRKIPALELCGYAVGPGEVEVGNGDKRARCGGALNDGLTKA